jgi:hypothetical protein
MHDRNADIGATYGKSKLTNEDQNVVRELSWSGFNEYQRDPNNWWASDTNNPNNGYYEQLAK